MIPPAERLQRASHDARELAHKIAPFMKELKAKLKTTGVNPLEMTASYILLQAAAGFLTAEEGRSRASTHFEAVHHALDGDLIEGQSF